MTHRLFNIILAAAYLAAFFILALDLLVFRP